MEILFGFFGLVFVFLWFAFGITAGVIAEKRGRSGIGWFLLGCIFGVFALIVVIAIPSRHDVPTADTHSKCPDCLEPVLKEARVCRHCRCDLVSQA